jgi:hypothetical protein
MGELSRCTVQNWLVDAIIGYFASGIYASQRRLETRARQKPNHRLAFIQHRQTLLFLTGLRDHEASSASSKELVQLRASYLASVKIRKFIPTHCQLWQLSRLVSLRKLCKSPPFTSACLYHRVATGLLVAQVIPSQAVSFSK